MILRYSAAGRALQLQNVPIAAEAHLVSCCACAGRTILRIALHPRGSGPRRRSSSACEQASRALTPVLIASARDEAN
eukprot:6177357-Pleurochrysis_carterae.AAC.2